MKKGTIYILSIFLILTNFSSCVKDITVDLPQSEDCLVVDGYIEFNDYPVVFLSKNSNYFQHLDTTIVKNMQIDSTQALVIVKSNGISDTLSYLPFPRWPYACFQGTKLKGQINQSYELTIKYQGSEYTSITQILDTVAIAEVETSAIGDTFALLNIKWKDPKNVRNYYAVTVRTQDQPLFYRPYIRAHIADDKLTDGEISEFSAITKGLERNSYYENYFTDEDSIMSHLGDVFCFKKDDTVSIKLSCLDNVSYNFWSSWYRNYLTDGNPFTNPATVKTNIVGEKKVRGCWIGYSDYIKTIYIPRTDTLVVLENLR